MSGDMAQAETMTREGRIRVLYSSGATAPRECVPADSAKIQRRSLSPSSSAHSQSSCSRATTAEIQWGLPGRKWAAGSTILGEGVS